MYIANIEELEKREREVREGKPSGEGDEEDDEEEEDEAPSQAACESVFSFERKTRAELAAERSAADGNAETATEEAPSALLGGMSIANPNRVKKPAEKMIKVKNVNEATAADPEAGFNRKER
jgi:hypothetical protein